MKKKTLTIKDIQPGRIYALISDPYQHYYILCKLPEYYKPYWWSRVKKLRYQLEMVALNVKFKISIKHFWCTCEEDEPDLYWDVTSQWNKTKRGKK